MSAYDEEDFDYDEEDGDDEDEYVYIEGDDSSGLESQQDEELVRLQNEHLAYYTQDTRHSAYKDCPKCGRFLSKSSSVCGHCGHRFGFLGWLFG